MNKKYILAVIILLALALTGCDPSNGSGDTDATLNETGLLLPFCDKTHQIGVWYFTEHTFEDDLVISVRMNELEYAKECGQ